MTSEGSSLIYSGGGGRDGSGVGGVKYGMGGWGEEVQPAAKN